MNKYVVFLRGINVGGKNIIKMSDLKKAVENCGFRSVSTIIQSGNVIFEAGEENIQKISSGLEDALSKTFNYQSRVVMLSYQLLKRVLLEVPVEWKFRDDLRCYIAFIREPVTGEEVLHEVKLRKGIDSAKTGKGVLYMTTILSGITKSGFSKLIGTKIYKDITIRNYTTVKKIFACME
jgi:uncharacterized protein (DUF1697 family)